MFHLCMFLFSAMLFYILTPGILLTIPKKSSKTVVALVHALVYATVLHFTHKIVWEANEGFAAQSGRQLQRPPTFQQQRQPVRQQAAQTPEQKYAAEQATARAQHDARVAPIIKQQEAKKAQEAQQTQMVNYEKQLALKKQQIAEENIKRTADEAKRKADEAKRKADEDARNKSKGDANYARIIAGLQKTTATIPPLSPAPTKKYYISKSV